MKSRNIFFTILSILILLVMGLISILPFHMALAADTQSSWWQYLSAVPETAYFPIGNGYGLIGVIGAENIIDTYKKLSVLSPGAHRFPWDVHRVYGLLTTAPGGGLWLNTVNYGIGSSQRPLPIVSNWPGLLLDQTAPAHYYPFLMRDIWGYSVNW